MSGAAGHRWAAALHPQEGWVTPEGKPQSLAGFGVQGLWPLASKALEHPGILTNTQLLTKPKPRRKGEKAFKGPENAEHGIAPRGVEDTGAFQACMLSKPRPQT